MPDARGAASLDGAWRAFVAGDHPVVVEQLGRTWLALSDVLRRPASRLGAAWDDDVHDAATEAVQVARLACASGELQLATAAHRTVLAATWTRAEEGSPAARWLQVQASCELAVVEAERNRASWGLRRLESLRGTLLDAELRDVLAEEPDVEQPLLGRVDDYLDWLRRRLGMLDPRPPKRALEPPLESLRPLHPGVLDSDDARRRWPSPLDAAIEVEDGPCEGLDQLTTLVGWAWDLMAAGRAAARDERHDEALGRFNWALQSAEAVHGSFRGSWWARSAVAAAVVRRSGSLAELGLHDAALDEQAVAAGLLEDAARDFPQVASLRSDEAFMASMRCWELTRLERLEDALASARASLRLRELSRTTPERELVDLLAVNREQAVELRLLFRLRRFRDAAATWATKGLPDAIELVRRSEHATVQRESRRRAEHATGLSGAVLRVLLDLEQRLSEREPRRRRPRGEG